MRVRRLWRLWIVALGLLSGVGVVAEYRSSLAAETELPLLAPFRLGDEENTELPFLLEAGETRYDETTDTVIAEGNVRISREGRILTADRVEYRLSNKIVAASGNVTLVEPTGEVLFAERVELTEDLDQGYAIAPRILLPDGSRVAAAGTSRLSKDRVVVQRAVFSPCNLCPSNPDRAPLWQLRAERITHSETRQEIELENAVLDVFGVPVAWLPYFSQPDPRVRKKTGFLTPTVGRDDFLGFFAEVPFFWNIAPHRDLTITPHIFSDKRPIVSGLYRHLFPFGETRIEASAGLVERTEDGETTGSDARGHLRWTGAADLNKHWRTNFQYYRSADDTYLRTFDIDDAGILRSFATTEGFYRRWHINATAFTTQEQRTNFSDNDTPTALPFVTARYAAPLGVGGLNLEAEFAGQVLFQSEGGESQHGVARVGVNRQWNLGGHLFTANADLRGDLFQSTESPNDTNGIDGKLFPRATAEWAFPLYRNFEGFTITLTPRAMATATVTGLNTDSLPNEDSQSLEFDSTALFRPTLADGRDLFDDGQRIDYGLEAGLKLGDTHITGLIGQTFHSNSSRDFGQGTGLSDPLSDVVLGLNLEAGNWLTGYQRLRLDTGDATVGSAESGLRLTRGPVQARLLHSYLPQRSFDGETLSETHQIEGSLRLQLNEHWAVMGRHRHDLDQGDTLRSEMGLSYADECFSLEVIGRRDRTGTDEVGSNDSIFFRVALRHLGAASGSQTLQAE